MKPISIIKKMVVGLITVFSLSTTAQNTITNTYNYKNAVGLRGGETSGLTYKHMFDGGSAFEGIVSVWPYTFGITGLYEKYKNIGQPGFSLYYGVGGHMNSGPARFRTYYLYPDRGYVYERGRSVFALGIDGIIGVEYKFKPIPLALSLDFKPYIEQINYWGTYMTLDPGLGIKITF